MCADIIMKHINGIMDPCKINQWIGPYRRLAPLTPSIYPVISLQMILCTLKVDILQAPYAVDWAFGSWARLCQGLDYANVHWAKFAQPIRR